MTKTTMIREWHFVYGGARQGWQFNPLIGWRQVPLDDMDTWARDSYSLKEWPHSIPAPIKAGPPRELF
jgi:hypothetical protein